MKRLLCIVLTVLLMAALTGCGGEKKAAAPTVEGTPAEIIEKIYENYKVELPLITRDVDLNDENDVSYNLGLTSGSRLSAAAISEPMMGQAYSLVLVRVKDAADAAQVAKEMYEKIDTRKWICVEADQKTAAYCGDVVMFFMVNSEFTETEPVAEAFRKVCGGSITVVG